MEVKFFYLSRTGEILETVGTRPTVENTVGCSQGISSFLSCLSLWKHRRPARHDVVLRHEQHEPALVVLALQPAHQRVQEVEERELHQRREHVQEAEDDEHVEGGGVANLRGTGKREQRAEG